MSTLRVTYLCLALLGAALPILALVNWPTQGVISTWLASDRSTGITPDLAIIAAALVVFIIAETLVRRDYWVMLCIPIIFFVGVSLAFPLYLFVRARPVS